MLNKVIITYFTPLSSCGNSLMLLKSSILDCKFIKIAAINQILGGSVNVIGIHSFCHGVGELIFLGAWGSVA